LLRLPLPLPLLLLLLLLFLVMEDISMSCIWVRMAASRDWRPASRRWRLLVTSA
jgi:hypothetical protein